MDFQLFCGLPLPHLWAVEAVARSNHVDTSLILDLLENTPHISTHIGENARELLSLKFLEHYLSIQGTHANPVSSALSKTVRLDPSDHCEDVLRRILHEISLSQSKPAGPGLSTWDLDPFIEHKRSNMFKYTLKQLKDEILAGSHSISASLKEKSGLLVGSHAGHQPLTNDDICIKSIPIAEGSGKDDCNLSPTDLPDGSLVPVNKKSRASECPAEQLCTTHVNPVKKNKHNVISNERDVGEQLRSSGVYIHVLDASTVFVPNTEGKMFHVGKKTNDGKMGALEPPKPGTNECSSSELGENSELLPGAKQVPHYDTELDSKSEGQQKQDWNIKEGDTRSADDEEEIILVSDDNGKTDIAGKEVVNISSANYGYIDEITTIDTRKRTFLSSQCTHSGDSLVRTDLGELQHCMKCNKDGNVLSCASDSCHIVIHENCLGADASSDMREPFYCPFCAYSQAMSRGMEVNKSVVLARQNLTTFLRVGSQTESNKQCLGSCRVDGNRLKQNVCLPKVDELNQTGGIEKVSNHQGRKKLEFDKAGPSKLPSDYSSSFGREGAVSASRLIQIPESNKKDGKRMREESHPTRGCKCHPIAAEAVQRGTNCLVSETGGIEKPAVKSKKEVLRPPETDLPRESKCSQSSQSNDSVEISEDENEDSGASRYFTRVRKPAKKSPFAAFPQMRRKKLRWTSEEEDMLKEGIAKFCNPHDNIYRWTMILENGKGKFDASRTAMDLKDKWRNMCKSNPKSK